MVGLLNGQAESVDSGRGILTNKRKKNSTSQETERGVRLIDAHLVAKVIPARPRYSTSKVHDCSECPQRRHTIKTLSYGSVS